MSGNRNHQRADDTRTDDQGADSAPGLAGSDNPFDDDAVTSVLDAVWNDTTQSVTHD